MPRRGARERKKVFTKRGALTFACRLASYRQMKRRAYIIGTVAVGLIAATAAGSEWRNVVSSAERVRTNFEDLRRSGSLNPVERFVFSLVLSGSETPPAALSQPVERPRT